MKDFLKKHYRIWFLIGSGLVTALTLVNPKLGFLQWLSMAPAAYVLLSLARDREVRLKKLYGYGLLYFMSYYVVIYHWFFYMYPLEFTGIGKGGALAVVLVADLGLSFFQAVGFAAVFPMIGALCRTNVAGRLPWAVPFSAAAVWCIAEWLQTFFWFGVPWGRLPLGQIENTLLVRSASLFGSYFITFVLVAVNFCFALILLDRTLEKILAVSALSLFCLNLALGLIVTAAYCEEGDPIWVAALQGNISSTEKWSASSRQNTLDRYEELTVLAAADGAELVLLPETALPYHVLDSESLRAYLSALTRDNDVTVLVSAFTDDPETGNDLNSLIQVKPDGSFGEEIYSKQRPVPFGEFVPMRELVMFLIPPLADIGMLDEDLQPGEESVVLNTEIGKVGCGICFDSIYETVTREAVLNGAELIAISTNDSWFSDSAALAMHNAQSRLRAIETGRYVVRSANTGISSVIDPLGNVRDSLGANETGYVAEAVYMREGKTLYILTGNLFIYLCIVAAALPLVLEIRAQMRKNK